MALSASQLAMAAEITRESYTDVETAANALNADQESLLADDLDTWEAIRNSHVRLSGGSDGIDLDNDRKRAAIFYRVRVLLGFDFVVYDLDGDVMDLVQLEVGQNFG
jgi:hypothetical protein